MPQPGLASAASAALGAWGHGGPWCIPRGGTSPAGLSLLAPSHFGGSSLALGRAGRAELGSQMEILLGEDPCTIGASVVERSFPP